MSEDAKEKAVLVTGGASGIGFETARILVERGWSVYLLDLKQEELDEACGTLALPRECGLACSVTDEGRAWSARSVRWPQRSISQAW